MTSYRLKSGGRSDRSKALGFRFDGRSYAGHPGDTPASLLLAAGVGLMMQVIDRASWQQESGELTQKVRYGANRRPAPPLRAETGAALAKAMAPGWE